ncbi:hypothetical protein F1728_04255 [Gimesia benthica]|uniref:Type I restriction modification DNA specificity domain-containing protein n=1 Tax=Gimesia benthica TaxID=2608982 RepID=A0A6I6AA41_9PLAN|nr:restriction endonuclease subunit S [Gimesia benthica]QGQ21949.1 hypothetical protein F1728_04255 [Gimesia benthica]
MTLLTKTEMRPLGDVCEVFAGYAWKSKQFNTCGRGLPVIRIQNVGTSDHSDLVYWEHDYNSRFLINEGDLLLSLSGSFRIAKWDGPLALLNQRVVKLTPNEELNERWLYYAISRQLDHIERMGKHALVNNVSIADLRRLEIPLPPLSEQKRIADILDKADAIRRKRQEATVKYGTLGASAFLEFFGDPLTNPQGWKLETLDIVASQGSRGLKRGPFGGALKKEIFVDQGFKVYEQKHAIADDFTIGSYYIDEDKYEEMKAFSVLPNDLIVSCSGTMGRVAIVPETAEPGIINQALLRITPDTSKVSSLYLKMLLETTPVQRHLYGFSRGSGLKNFPPMSEVRSLPVPIPSSERLSDFHKYMVKVDTAGKKLAEVEKDTEKLFNSLVQRAFKGQL